MSLHRAFVLGLSLLGLTIASPLLPTLGATQKRAIGFQIVPEFLLEDSELDPTCHQVLQQTIACDEHVARLGQPEYHGSLENAQLTDAVCAVTCKASLTQSQRRIQGACGSEAELVHGLSVSAFIDSTISGWNETCLQDPDTGKYCNNIIRNWPDYETLEEMPRNRVCSFCFGAKLRMMQASPYSGYDSLFAETLSYINQECEVVSPTEPIVSPEDHFTSAPCYTGRTYTTKEGDSCDSIALEYSLSAATLSWTNGNINNCDDVGAGHLLCLPESCEHIHQVQEGDDCYRIGHSLGTWWQEIVDWNRALDSRCSNLWATSPPFWGHVVCISAPGVEFVDDGPSQGELPPADGDLGGEGGNGYGYSENIAELPEGELADGTTEFCGHFVQAEDPGNCPRMLVSTTNAVPIDLFLEVNPSLKTAKSCNDDLVPGLWYCLTPYLFWDQMRKDLR